MNLIKEPLDYAQIGAYPNIPIFTASSSKTHQNRLVLDSESAIACSEVYPEIDVKFGEVIAEGEAFGLSVIEYSPEVCIGAFQVKREVNEPASGLYLMQAIDELLKMIRVLSLDKPTFHLPFPGIENNELHEDSVYPLLYKLPTNVKIYKNERKR